ncbi:sensor histidine kinase [Nocardiopsis sp. HNM0947]|uniref:histidine kinase n=1 Tax=Nocardiopsis coralli TaxID=2772213 RepID=A0ABR9P4K9_9ACTN|nr:sensor histidine kinase [Nocardiopsis coralli]MBE2998781.1 sensor histidine kinase [Nocardiopsis coralli]
MRVGPLPGPSPWVALRPDRPPRILQVLFWGNMATTFAVFGFTAWAEREHISTAPPEVTAVVVAATLSAVLCCLLWPFAAWSPHAPARRRAVSAAFLVVAVLCTMTSNATMFLLVCVASVQAVAVFGVTGGAVHAVLLAAFGLSGPLFIPEMPLWAGVYTAATMLFLAAVSAALFLALTVAARRAEHTRDLLAELEQAHGELRVRNRQVREMTLAEERSRMAREMHDSTGHHLTALAMTLSNALRFRTHRPDEAWTEVEQARDLAREALEDTRRWVRALRPLTLEGVSGPEAMRALAGSFDGTGLRVDFTAEGTWPDPPEAAELVCYRALQEGLANAVRHSGAGRIGVHLRSTPDTVELMVEDDGQGAGAARTERGFGLRGIAERAGAVGGAMTAGNGPEGGFLLRVEVPASEPSHEALSAREGAA